MLPQRVVDQNASHSTLRTRMLVCFQALWRSAELTGPQFAHPIRAKRCSATRERLELYGSVGARQITRE
jgi:hypothetical protein